MKNIASAFLLTLISILQTYAATLSGKITDAGGQALGFATILIKGTDIGTAANGEGNYALELAPGNYAITCQFMGYASRTQYLEIGEDPVTLNFRLAPQSLDISEVLIRAEGPDPAYVIMRKVIESRKIHADLIRSLETEVYLKGTLRTRAFPDKIAGISINEGAEKDVRTEMGLDSNGKGILYLVEELSHYYYRQPNKTYNKVISVRESGDPKGLGFASLPPVINIYDNNIYLLGLNRRGFISPANGNAFFYYTYQFLGSYIEDGKTIHKIKVTPKRKYEPLFSGYVYVVDQEWVFKSIDLTLTRLSQMDALDTLRLEQYFRPVARELWVIQSQVLYPAIDLFGIDITGNFVTVYRNQKVNQPLAEDIFSSKVIASYDSAATSRDTSYWDTIRPIPLEEDEVKDFHFKDSIFTANRANEDSLEKLPRYNLGISAFLLGRPSIKVNKNKWSMRPLVSAIQFNSVEGMSTTLDINWEHRYSEHTTIYARWLNRYGWESKKYYSLFKAGASFGDPAWKKRMSRIVVTGGTYLYQINDRNPISPILNEGYTLLGGKNYLKLYERRLIKISGDRDWANGFTAGAAVSYEQRRPLVNSSDYTFSAPHDDRIRPNQPENLPPLARQDAALVSASLSYQPGIHYIQYPGYKAPIPGNAPIFTLSYTRALPGVGNATADFDKWQADIRDELRLRMLGSLSYHLAAGGFLSKKEVNLPDWHHLNGNQTFLAGPYLNSFQLAPYYRFSNTADIYLEAHAEWHMGGLITNKIPLFRRLNWHLVGGSNVLYINRDDYYAEIFIGLENIGWKLLRFGRVDFIAGYEGGKPKPSLGLRVSLGGIFNTLFGTRESREL